jgi:hypothetical protein
MPRGDAPPGAEQKGQDARLANAFPLSAAALIKAVDGADAKGQPVY